MAGAIIFPRAERQTDTPRRKVALSEVMAGALGDAGAVGFVLSRLAKGAAPVLWIQDRMSRRETGRPYLAVWGRGGRF